MVTVDFENEIYNCECCKFNKDGILCCHVMKVMSHIGAVRRIPDHYILPRWSVPPPDVVAPVVEVAPKPTTKLSRKDMRMLRYGNMCSDFAKRAVALAASEKTAEIAERHMKAMDRELADLKKANAEALKRKKKKKNVASSERGVDESGSASTDEGTGPTKQQTDFAANKKARDPPVSNPKGRPVSKRMKSGLHLNKPHPTECSICNELGHDARNFPVRLANLENYPIHSMFQK